MRRFACSAAFLLPLLAACNSSESGTITGENGEQVDYEVSADGTQSDIRITNENGEEAVIATTDTASDLPLGFTAYPGAKIVSNSKIDSADGSGAMVYMTTPDSADKVIAHYRAQAEAAGIEIGLEQTAGETRTLGGEGEGGKALMLTAGPDAGPDGAGTAVNLMIGQDN